MMAPLQAWISALYLTEEAMGFPVSWNAWEEGTMVDFGNDVSVMPYPNGHLRACYAGKPGDDASRPCESFSLEAICGSFRAIFSGDLASPSELAPLLEGPVSVLVCELSHFRAEELAAVLQPAALETLCLVHLDEDYAMDRGQVRALLQELLPQVSDVFLPEDGEVIDF
jgi:ribonuclease BN (tRNA processing enzyme)